MRVHESEIPLRLPNNKHRRRQSKSTFLILKVDVFQPMILTDLQV